MINLHFPAFILNLYPSTSNANSTCISILMTQEFIVIHVLNCGENNCNVSMQRLTRSKGGVNEWLHWLPAYLHKFIGYVIRKTYSYSRLMITSRGYAFGKREFWLNMARQSYQKDGPLLVIACGRDTISISSSIKRLASENAFVIQDLNSFDMVITSRHDYYPLTPRVQEKVAQFLKRWITPSEAPDKHVVLTLGALHQIDFAALCNVASAWHDEFIMIKAFADNPKV
ncbi:hypothetical protein K2173_020721 [Erythroxylum novogranatense]|uniref:Uncharacterized protein n=1 Tax=Erythroxylum novogranatense TaxID=1862640 RepID=A0AAV8TLM2_9ROSI|nr:hypothetical protein K2173_020721 [Erythroxylum novogranatense]